MQKNGLFLAVSTCLLGSGILVGQEPPALIPSSPPLVFKLEVELRGTLSYTDKETTITVQENVLNDNGDWRFEERIWVLDFAGDKKLRKEAPQLNKRVVLVTGSSRLLGVRSIPFKRGLTAPVSPPIHMTETGISSALEVERRVRVTTLEAMKR